MRFFLFASYRVPLSNGTVKSGVNLGCEFPFKEMITYSGSKRTKKLVQPTHKGSFGSRSFGRVGPKLWNLLPMNLRTETDTSKFKKDLKTFLFDGFFDFEQKIKES